MTDRLQVGDLVRDAEGRERVVTDLRQGRPVLRPRHGAPKEAPADPAGLTLIARRGEWR